MLGFRIHFLFALLMIALLAGCQKTPQEEGKKNEAESTKQEAIDKGIDPLLADFAPLPSSFIDLGIDPEKKIEALVDIYGQPTTIEEKDSFQFATWEKLTVGDCSQAQIHLRSFKEAEEKSSFILDMRHCHRELLTLLKLMGSPGIEDVRKSIWFYQEALVKQKEASLEFQPYKKRELKKLADDKTRREIIRNMKRDLAFPDLSAASPEAGRKQFTEALLNPSLWIGPELAYPFSADGRVIESEEEIFTLISKFDDKKRAQIEDDRAHATLCDSITFEGFLAGEALHGWEDKERDKEQAQRYFRKLPGFVESGDTLLKCYDPQNPKWEGISITYRKVGDKWQPSGYLD